MSDIKRIHAGLIMLRNGELEKEAEGGIAGGLKTLWHAAKRGSTEAGKAAEPVIGKTLGKVVSKAPEAAVAYGGYKAYKSPTGQNLRYKYQLYKERKRQRKMQQGGY